MNTLDTDKTAYTFSNGIPTPKSILSIKSLEDAVEKLRGIPPANWILISPDGKTFAGPDPLILALQAKPIPAFNHVQTKEQAELAKQARRRADVHNPVKSQDD